MNLATNKIYYIAIITFSIVLSYYLLAGKNKFPNYGEVEEDINQSLINMIGKKHLGEIRFI